MVVLTIALLLHSPHKCNADSSINNHGGDSVLNENHGLGTERDQAESRSVGGRLDLEAYKAKLLEQMRMQAKEQSGKGSPETLRNYESEPQYHNEQDDYDTRHNLRLNEGSIETLSANSAITQYPENDSEAHSHQNRQRPHGQLEERNVNQQLPPASSAADLKSAFRGDVDANDPHIQAIFPEFSQSYRMDKTKQQSTEDMRKLSFVDRSDFAVLDGSGQVESYGSLDELGQVIGNLEQEQENMKNAELEYEQSIKDEEDDLEYMDLGNSPTTLMLFNIFTPDEVDFLSALVGDDAVKELRDDAIADEEKTNERSKSTYGKNTNVPANGAAEQSIPQRNGQIQHYNIHQQSQQVPKNVYPSSQAADHQDLSIHGSLQANNKPGLSGDGLEEEGKIIAVSGSNDSKNPTNSLTDNNNLDRYQAARQRKQKMEEMLAKLTEKYNKNQEERHSSSIHKADGTRQSSNAGKTDKMKEVIAKLKTKMTGLSTGINRMDLKNIEEDWPTNNHYSNRQNVKYYHTTRAPVRIEAVGQILSDKIGKMSIGVHRLNLDELLDLDTLNVKTDRGGGWRFIVLYSTIYSKAVYYHFTLP